MKKQLRAFMIAASIITIGSCGADTSFNQLFTQDGSDERLDAMLAQGRALYDEGKFDEASEILTEATEKFPLSEEAAILSSYTELGAAGLSLFDVLKVVALQPKDIESLEEGKVKECASLTDIIATGGNRGKLDCMLGLELNSDVFEGQDLETVRTTNPVLVAVTKVVNNLCGFYDDPTATSTGQRVDGFARHDCTTKAVKGDASSRGTFVWALAHLFEATVLNIQSTYLEQQAQGLGTATDNIATAMSTLGNIVSATSTTANFANEALYDLTAATNSLSIVLGSDSDLGALNDATANLRTAIDSSFGTGTEKGSVVNKIDTAIVARKDEINGSALSAEEKAEFCQGYEDLGGDTNNFPADITITCP